MLLEEFKLFSILFYFYLLHIRINYYNNLIVISSLPELLQNVVGEFSTISRNIFQCLFKISKKIRENRCIFFMFSSFNAQNVLMSVSSTFTQLMLSILTFSCSMFGCSRCSMFGHSTFSISTFRG
jgi:hypothetical protein